MSMRPVYAHVGCSKTGTSSFQAGLWASVQRLEAADVGVPFVGRRAHRRRLLDPFGWQPATGFADGWDDAALEQTRTRLANARGHRVLISNEDLMELPARGVDRFQELTAAAGLELHLVVTLRDWAQQIPSEYQQFLRHGMHEPYLDFIRQVRDREGRWGEHFWRRQDPVDIQRRWSAVDADRITFVVVPSYSADPGGVFRLMNEALGLDPGLIGQPGHAVNTSHGVIEAEVFRRINAALPEAFDDYSEAYRQLVRRPLTTGVLPTEASARLELPVTELTWVQERSQEAVIEIRTSGCKVMGELDALIPTEERTSPYTPVDDADVARAAVETFARFAERARRRERKAYV
ncbi:hypothetical protein [Nocardioides ungokensis]|uniref:hypothetical protein n=1 Tax=Nocardioides ungokensis TaxID=1643322 RepID=UPI0015DFA05A|nr:hypothetical protein [Nocardioides ungokensis]